MCYTRRPRSMVPYKRKYYRRKSVFKNFRKFSTRQGASISAVTIPGTATIPRLLVTTFRWINRYNLVGTTGATTNVVFSGNSIHIPDVTNTAGPCYYVTAMSAMYAQYQVLWTTANFTFTIANIEPTPNNVNVWAVPYYTNTLLTYDDAKPLTGCISETLNPTSGPSRKKISLSTNITQLSGIINNTVDTRAGLASNPTNQFYFIIGMQSADQVSTTAVNVEVEIFYKTRLMSVLFETS